MEEHKALIQLTTGEGIHMSVRIRRVTTLLPLEPRAE